MQPFIFTGVIRFAFQKVGIFQGRRRNRAINRGLRFWLKYIPSLSCKCVGNVV